MARILVVDDDVTVREVVVSYLRAGGHETDDCGDGEKALRLFVDRSPDLVVLDLMLPGLSGLEVCRRIRAREAGGQRAVPVLMLTALGEEDDRIAGLEGGADDYVPKPFSPRELVLRVEALLRRSGEAERPQDGVITDGDLRLDPTRHEVLRGGVAVSLTAREFALLHHLISHPGVALRREDLLREVWGWSFGDDSTVTVHVRRLREKLEEDPTTPTRLVTVWGVGYRWEPAEGAGGPA